MTETTGSDAVEASSELLIGLLGDSESEAPRRLLLSGISQFAARGYNATTTREICAGANLSSAALYVYFESKESLLFQISEIGHLGVMRAVQGEMNACRSTREAERLSAFVRGFVRFHAKANTLARVCQHELRSLNPENFRTIARLRREVTNLLQEILMSGMEGGEFRIRDLESTSLAIMSLGIDVARWFRQGGSISSDQLASRYAELALIMVEADSHLAQSML